MITNHTLLFKTQRNSQYLYDDKTGTILPINDILAKAIDLFASFSAKEVYTHLSKEFPESYVQGTLKFLERWFKQHQGIFASVREKTIIRYQREQLTRANLNTFLFHNPSSFRQLILHLTENCNLQCKYCVYSDNYQYSRPPSEKELEIETGKKAIDYFFQLNEPLARRNPAKRIAINFYGGEPLLGLAKMAELIPYAKQKAPLPVNFFMTTNGLLLNDQAADFIVKNNIYVTISLDGSKENHDRNRLTTGGTGSFDIVFRNIQRFMKRYPDYIDKLSLICVYDWNTDLEANVRFFEENELPRLSFVDAVSSGCESENYYRRFSPAEKERYIKQGYNLMTQFVAAIMEGRPPLNFIRAFCSPRFLHVFLHPRAHDKRPDLLPFTGTCVPGEKISVRVDGTFDLCERVNPTLPIGDVKKGLDLDAIYSLIEKYNQALGEKCFSCPISKLCSVCFGDGSTMENADFSISEATRCQAMRAEQTQCFELVYSILEEKPDAFQWLNDLMEKPDQEFRF